MAIFPAYGHQIKVKWYEAIFPCLYGAEQPRKVPRNVFDFVYFGLIPFFFLCFIGLMWLLSHVPFIAGIGIIGFTGGICALVCMKTYMDSTRAWWMLILASVLLYKHVTFGMTVFGFHLETYIYYIAIGACLLALYLRLYNYLSWKQIDHICAKYGIPKYDQRELMNAYEGYETYYGLPRKKSYANYAEAVAAAEQAKETGQGEHHDHKSESS